MASAAPALVKADWRAALSREEIAPLLLQSDLRSWISIGVDWALVFAAFASVAAWPNPLTIVFALFVIGARQLGLAVLMHEAAHRTLLRDRRWNDWVGNWLCAYPVWGDLVPYRPYHLQHHSKTWTKDDPDLALADAFPITRRSLVRKIWRDLSGQTGWKRAKATLRRDLGRSQGRVRRLDWCSRDHGGWRLSVRRAILEERESRSRDDEARDDAPGGPADSSSGREGTTGCGGRASTEQPRERKAVGDRQAGQGSAQARRPV